MHYEFHPIAELFPPLTEAERNELADGIKAVGQLHPITLYEGKILDGRQRYLACAQAGIEPKFEQLKKGLDPYEFVANENLQRRHLTVSQRATIAARMANLKNGSNQFVKKEGVGKPTPSVKGGYIAAQEAAEIMGVHRSTVYEAKKLMRDDPKRFEEVAAGKQKLGSKGYRKNEEEGATAVSTLTETEAAAKSAQKEFISQQLEIVNRPSIFPSELPLPVHPTEGGTQYIQEAILSLRKEEPSIAQMKSRRELLKRVHVYTQRIQTYGPMGANHHIRGPIDERFVDWAKDCFTKLRAMEAIFLCKEDAREERQKASGRKPGSQKKEKQPSFKVGDEYARLYKTMRPEFKRLLTRFQFPSQYEEQLRDDLNEELTKYFAEKRARVRDLQTDGAKAPKTNGAQIT